MAPFRNLLGRKPAPPTGADDRADEKSRTSTDGRPGPLSIRKSNDSSTNEYKLSVDENEPFSISRESFDSYRRSFDISARSPISYTDTMPSRTSLDSRFSHVPSSPAARGRSFEKPCPESTEEECFVDVGLNDDVKPKKKGIFSRLGDFSSSNDSQSPNNSRPSSSHLGFHIPGRKRGQSGGASELGSIKSQPAVTESEAA
ncbi:hypothetical protein MPDQ_006683 [Monascus purpureus]|uniref:Uncharacterized protein n=1 Tax=Monascus purpureus TaxID=5098 RepID=A0A507QY71_MONPU|nr:hypothetical protein MPDQ_006683 [Monascus purpureus]